MRLKSYLITESRKKELPLYTAITLINKNCKAYLREFNKMTLFRGIGEEKVAWEVKPRKDRRPLDTDRKVHNILNTIFEDMFGWPVRNGVFVSTDGNWDMTDMMFFAGGKYKYVYSPIISDLYRQGSEKTILDMLRDNDIDGIEEWIESKGYTDKNLNKIIRTEASFNCKYYYLLNKNYMKEFY
jgi:hypothetical protein